mgnify:CR=1 FL=1
MSMSNLSVRNCRSSLFWGALRLPEFHSELRPGADIVCIDLEDAVPPSDKARAREMSTVRVDCEAACGQKQELGAGKNPKAA